jgi:hypothetical protein
MIDLGLKMPFAAQHCQVNRMRPLSGRVATKGGRHNELSPPDQELIRQKEKPGAWLL